MNISKNVNTAGLNLSDKEKFELETEHFTEYDIAVLADFVSFVEDIKNDNILDAIQNIVSVDIMNDSSNSEQELILNELMMHFNTNKLTSMAVYRIIRKRVYDLYQLAIK